MTNQPPDDPWGQQPWGQQPPGQQPWGQQPPGQQPWGQQPPGQQPPNQGYAPPPSYPTPQYGQPAGPPPRRGRGKIVAICAAVAVVLAGGGFAASRVLGGSSNTAQKHTQPSVSGSGAGGGTGGANKKCAPLADISDTAALQQALTDAIETHDRTAFLALASTGTARARMGLWWDNASAVGFSAGEAYADNDANAGGPDRALTSVVLDVALHSPLDVVSPGKYGSGTLAPMTQYKAGVVRAGSACSASLTSWTSLANTPLDVPEHLYVVHTAHTVVAGEPAMRSEVDRIAPIAEKAAAWDFSFFQANRGRHDNFVQQKGFVVYLPTTAKQTEGWFRAPTAPKAKGWTADAGNVAGTSYPLPGPNSTGTPKLKGTKLGQGSAVAGARVLLTRTGRSGSSTGTEAVLVHEFVHDLLTTNDISAYLGGKPLAAATSEGAARWIESYFRSRPSGYKVGKSSAAKTLRPTIRASIGRFTGTVPTDSQIYGSSSLANFYYDLSASTFDYIAYRYGSAFALQSVFDAYTNGGGPFSGIVSSTKGGTITFDNPDSYIGPWSKWVRAGLPG